MRRIVPAVVVALALVACGGDGDSGDERIDSAIAAFEDLIEAQLKGQFGRVYDMVHPAQQEIMSRSELEACLSTDVAAELVGIKYEEHYTETLVIPGTDVKVESLAFTAEVELRSGQIQDGYTDTFNAYDVDGEWKFTYDADTIDCVELRS